MAIYYQKEVMAKANEVLLKEIAEILDKNNMDPDFEKLSNMRSMLRIVDGISEAMKEEEE